MSVKYYTLKHKNVSVLRMQASDNGGDIQRVEEIYSDEHMPVGIHKNQHDFIRILNKWWFKRFISDGRDNADKLRPLLKILSTDELAFKSYGLSMSDHYWVHEDKDSSLKWEDINYFTNPFPQEIGDYCIGKYGHKPDNLSFETPDIAINGWLNKRWVSGGHCLPDSFKQIANSAGSGLCKSLSCSIEGWEKTSEDNKLLIKAGSDKIQQEPYNEAFATKILEALSIPHVPYKVIHEKGVDNIPYSVCLCLTSVDTEIVPAWMGAKAIPFLKEPSLFERILNRDKEYAPLEKYIASCEYLGIPTEESRDYLNKMIVFDYLIMNEDRHFSNFGLLRDSNSGKIIGHTPIFDNGTSLWMHHSTEYLKRQKQENFSMSGVFDCRSFAQTHEEQIKLVSSFDWIDISKLKGLEQEFIELTKNSDCVDKERAELIAWAFSSRVEALEKEISQKQTQTQSDIFHERS